MSDDILLSGDFQCRLDQLEIVGLAHIGKTGTQAIVIDSDQGVVSHEVDVVLDHHDVATTIVRIKTANGVGDDQEFGAQGLHDTNWQSNALEGMTFVVVNPPLHRDHRKAF